MNVGWPEAVIAIAGFAAVVGMFFLIRHRLKKATVRMPGVTAGFEANEEQRGLSEQELQAHDSVFKRSRFHLREGVRTAFFRSKVKHTTVTITGRDSTPAPASGTPVSGTPAPTCGTPAPDTPVPGAQAGEAP
ncbi:hypothetical protein ACIQ62_30260 [Streptomyces sp. NPDC096319]|uniref:hypothetical protein n=1 Tax=Streptomyces sp. NPDC096319 TaxID=3366084 RepID=UPI00381B9189